MLKLKPLYLLCLCIAVQNSYSQNLVINPSFEDYDTCVANISSFGYPYVNSWHNPTIASTDYFNTCSINPTTIPQSAAPGSINPRTGNGIAGCIFHSDPSTTAINGEFVQGAFSTPLIQDSFYCVRFYVALASELKLAVDRIGVKFSDVLYNFSSTDMPFPADLETPVGRFYTDIGVWKKVQMIYQADGSEEYITIGNFREIGGETNTRMVGTPFGDFRDETSYYFIDDVSVEMIPSYLANLNLGNDSILCDTSGFSQLLTVPPVYDSVHWSTGASGFQLLVNNIGTYTATAYIGDCEVKDVIEFSLFNGNTFTTMSDLEYCQSDTPILVAAPPGFDSYQWSTADTSVNVELFESGIYSLSASDRCHVYVDSFELLVKPNPAAPIAVDTTLCEGTGSIAATAEGSNLKWYASIDANVALGNAPEIGTDNPGMQQYYVSQTENGCESERSVYTAMVNPLPKLALKAEPSYCIGEIIRLNADEDFDYNYTWTTGDISSFIDVQASGIYGVTVENACGSIDDSVEITFSNCEDCVYIPNAFTPNGDFLNDVFRAYSLCPLRRFSIQIFNRWGALVFESGEISTGWDGNHKGITAEAGVYVYRASYIYENSKMEKRKGSITLLK